MLHSDSVGLNLFWYSFVLKLYVMVETGDHCQLKMAGKTPHFGDRICLSKRTRRFTRYTSGSHVLCDNVEQSRNDSGIAFAGAANGCTSKEVTEIGPSWHFKGGGGEVKNGKSGPKCTVWGQGTPYFVQILKTILNTFDERNVTGNARGIRMTMQLVIN